LPHNCITGINFDQESIFAVFLKIFAVINFCGYALTKDIAGLILGGRSKEGVFQSIIL